MTEVSKEQANTRYEWTALVDHLSHEEDYAVFIDESFWDDSDLGLERGEEIVYVAIAVCGDRVPELEQNHESILREHDIHLDPDGNAGEFHATHLFHGKGLWRDVKPPVRLKVFQEIADLVRRFSDRVFYVWMSECEFKRTPECGQSLRDRIAAALDARDVPQAAHWDLLKAGGATKRLTFTAIPALLSPSRIVMVADRSTNENEGLERERRSSPDMALRGNWCHRRGRLPTRLAPTRGASVG